MPIKNLMWTDLGIVLSHNCLKMAVKIFNFLMWTFHTIFWRKGYTCKGGNCVKMFCLHFLFFFFFFHRGLDLLESNLKCVYCLPWNKWWKIYQRYPVPFIHISSILTQNHDDLSLCFSHKYH